MIDNLKKRLQTSIFLSFFLFVGIFINNISWLILLLISSFICFIEFFKLIKKIGIIEKKFFYLINFLTFIYLLFFIYTSYSIYLNSINFLIFSILICILSDTGGYLVGKLIGGTKLTKISPNKTISGSIGSLIFSILPLTIYLFFIDEIYKINLIENNINLFIILSLFLSIICQLGDLVISYFKRKSNVKDTGSILPGHGGLLDRIDGALFVLPVSYIILKLFLI